MARRKRFTQEELECHLEMIGVYWHRHGYEEETELKDYIRALYEAVPEDRRELNPAVADGRTVAVDLEELDQLLYGALSPVFDEQAVAEELEEFVGLLEAHGGERSAGLIRVKRAALRESFELRFSPTMLNDELIERLQVVREFLTI